MNFNVVLLIHFFYNRFEFACSNLNLAEIIRWKEKIKIVIRESFHHIQEDLNKNNCGFLQLVPDIWEALFNYYERLQKTDESIKKFNDRSFKLYHKTRIC